MKTKRRNGMDIEWQELPKGKLTYGRCRIAGCSFDFTCPVCRVAVPANTEHECEFGKKEQA